MSPHGSQPRNGRWQGYDPPEEGLPVFKGVNEGGGGGGGGGMRGE